MEWHEVMAEVGLGMTLLTGREQDKALHWSEVRPGASRDQYGLCSVHRRAQCIDWSRAVHTALVYFLVDSIVVI